MLEMSPVTLLRLVLLSSFFLFQTTEVHALTISPVKAELSGDPGQVIRAEVELLNEQNEPKTFYVSYENFEPSGEDGSPKFIGGGSGLATWLSSETAVTLSPNEKKVVPYTVTIPKEAEAGGYFGAVFFGGQNPNATDGGEISVGGKLGTLILLRVRGDIPEDAGLSDFMIQEGRRFFSELPVSFTYRVTNDGGDRIVPSGDIKVTNTFGMTSVTLALNETAGSILPASARRFNSVWGTQSKPAGFFGTAKRQWNDLHFGWYTAHARVAWGEENTYAVARYDFFMIPWQLTTIAVLILAVFLSLVRKYNSWIVSRAQKGS